MPEEKEMDKTKTNPNETGGKVDDSAVDYLAAIKQLKETTVPRSDYDKVKEENKKLLNAVVNGQQVNVPETKEKKDIKEHINKLRQDLFNSEKELSNLEYVSKALELRTALIENGEPDPFLPIGRKISPSHDDVESAERCAQVFKECIDYAEGSDSLFTSELDRRTKDVKIPLRKNK